MRKSKLLKKLTAVTLSAAMVLSMSACSKSNGAGTDKKGNPITLTVFSQLANYIGDGGEQSFRQQECLRGPDGSADVQQQGGKSDECPGELVLRVGCLG